MHKRDIEDLRAVADHAIASGGESAEFGRDVRCDVGAALATLQRRARYGFCRALVAAGCQMNSDFAPLPEGKFGVILADPPWRFVACSAKGESKLP